MKMKKIVSVFAAFAMLASMSVTAFAANYNALDESYGFSIGTAPKATITITRDDVEADENDMYTYTTKVAMSDLGTIGSKKVGTYYDEDAEEDVDLYVALKITSAQIALKTSEPVTIVGDATSDITKLPSVLVATESDKHYSGIYGLAYAATSQPTYSTGAPRKKNASVNEINAFEFKFKAKAGTKVDLIEVNKYINGGAEATDPYNEIQYSVLNSINNVMKCDDTATQMRTLTYTGDTSYTCTAPTPVSKDIAIEASAEATTATGYVWNVALTNAAKINEFKATFKATGLEDAVRYIRNIDKVAAAVSGEGSLNFQVGVLTDTTSKTGVTAKFDVKDSDGKTASATVAAK